MPKRSPPKHRHDGTSPLPLGMDWSPPPKRWDGRNTTWPHNPQTGWSYCVLIPSWIVQAEPGASHESFLNPIVFYRIHVGIQSPEGVSTSHGLLRRFSDFLKLYTVLKKAFPKKDIPQAPPKHALLRINSSRLLLEERRQALEEWMGKLLSDIDLSRSAPVADFLELESAARSSFQNANHPQEPSSSSDAATMAPSIPARSTLNTSIAECSIVPSKSQSVASDSYSKTGAQTSDLSTQKKWNIQVSETSVEDLSMAPDVATSTVATGNGLAGKSFLDQPEDYVTSKLNHKKENHVSERQMIGGNLSRDQIESMSDNEFVKLSGHARKFSAESIESDVSSIRGSEVSIAGGTNSTWEGFLDIPSDAGTLNSVDPLTGLEIHSLDHVQIVLPFDQKIKLNRVLVTMQRRLLTAKTDMEDLIARLNQEMAVKEYLTTKVKDLEVELEASDQRGRENLQQAILTERERVTQMQWDMDELRRRCSEMEAKLIFEQNQKNRELENTTSDEKELLLQELHHKREELQNMQKCLEELELKSKADLKVLVKEVKSLRKSQAELKEMLNQSLKEKNELEAVLYRQKQRWSNKKEANKKLLRECIILRDRLQECSVGLLSEEDKFTIPSSLPDALDLLATSDNRIGLLLAEAQLLARDDEVAPLNVDDARTTEFSETAENGDASIDADDETRKILTDIFIDNARLRKQVNSVIRYALSADARQEREDSNEMPSRKTVLDRLLER